MARLNWNSPGERIFETGVDRGVLYTRFGVGVAWNGLISVRKHVSGGEPKPHYIDGFKYLNRTTPEEVALTIEAFTYPDEFAECDGTLMLFSGLSVTQQRRQPFDFSYRTKIGNDIDGADHGYKIHLIYNALASPTEQTNETMNDSPEAANFSWAVTTSPVLIPNRRPSSHFIVDSRKTPPLILTQLEDILYGTDDVVPRAIRPSEILDLFNDSPEDVFTADFGEFF